MSCGDRLKSILVIDEKLPAEGGCYGTECRQLICGWSLGRAPVRPRQTAQRAQRQQRHAMRCAKLQVFGMIAMREVELGRRKAPRARPSGHAGKDGVAGIVGKVSCRNRHAVALLV